MSKCRGNDEIGSDYTHLRHEPTPDEKAYAAGWLAAMRQQNVPMEQMVDPPEYHYGPDGKLVTVDDMQAERAFLEDEGTRSE